MNLKEIKSLIDNKTVEVRETMNMIRQMDVNSYRFEHGTEISYEPQFLVSAPHEFTVDELYEKVKLLDREIFTLKAILAEKNQAVKVTYNGEEMSITGAVVLLKTLRSRLPVLNRLAALKESRNIVSPGRYSEETKTYVDVQKPVPDVKKYREEVKLVEMEIMKLQSVLDAANLSTEVTI